MLVSIVLIDVWVRCYDKRPDVVFRLCVKLSIEARLVLNDVEQFFHLQLKVRFSLIEDFDVLVIHRVAFVLALVLFAS